MADELRELAASYAQHFKEVCGLPVSVFEYDSHDFIKHMNCDFCVSCQGACHNGYQNTHLYGCYEAERWNGLYIYQCPLGISFITTAIYAGEHPVYALISGPFIIGDSADALSAGSGVMAGRIAALAAKDAGQVNHLAQMQWAICMFLSKRDYGGAGIAGETQNSLHNTLYELAAGLRGGKQVYPLEVERKLQYMIQHGDRQGAGELINQLLGHVYFASGCDFKQIRENARELVVLFSRAAINGGADAQRIFGHTPDAVVKIEKTTTLDELSVFLTSLFHRFVGYVFDFSAIRHTDVVHKIRSYILQYYPEKLSLEEVAPRVYLSSSHVSRILRAELGLSFTELVNTIRVEKSKELLENRSLTLADIASTVGFSDQSYFAKVFKKIIGISPGAYREDVLHRSKAGTAYGKPNRYKPE